MLLIREYIREILLSEAMCSSPRALFMAGGPGSGKSTVIDELGLRRRLRVINPDDVYEESLKAAGIPLDRSEIVSRYKLIKQKYLQATELNNQSVTQELEPEYLALRAIVSKNMQLFSAARAAAKKTQEQYTCDSESFLVDGTGGNFRQVTNQARELQDMGYDVAMVYVGVPLSVSIDRNTARGKEGGRRLHDDTVAKSWNAVNKNKAKYANFFGKNFFYIDASEENFHKSIDKITSQVNDFVLRE